MISPGDKVKHYDILELLGKGGMGEVFLAQDTVLDRKVAIKFLPEEMQKDESARVRLLREAKAAASLDHPFICKIYEAGEFNGKVFIVMEYVEGKDLRVKIDEGIFSLREALQMAIEIAEALEDAHNKGIVHRDLKPSNIMLTPQGHAKVMDFGLAKHFLTEGEEDITKTLTKASITEKGAVVGTIAYMSPEQARGEAVDARSDIFSLGMIIYEMTTGRHPFSKSSPIETLTSILRDATPPVSVKPKMMNPILTPIVRRALAKEPSERYQSIKDLISDLRKLQSEFFGGVRFIFRGWPMIVGAILIVAMLLTGVYWLFLRPKAGAPGGGPEPISVLIADFQNWTGDSIFDGALEPALAISLEGASFISVYDRAQARSLVVQLDPSSKGQLDSDRAQLVSRREGIDIIISASIEPSGDGFIINAVALDSATYKKIAEASIPIETKAEVLRAADRLAAELRSDLGDATADTAQPVIDETVTASSLQAWKAYVHAQELAAEGKDDEAIQEFLKAIDLDPKLGRAYAALAVVYRNLGNIEKAKECYEKAMPLLESMTERERYRTRGSYYFVNRNFKKAIDEYSALYEQFPMDTAAHINLPLAYFYARDMQKAFETGKQAVELNPRNISACYNQLWYAIGAGKFDEAEQEFHKVLELNPKFGWAYVCLALIRLAQDRPDEAVDSYHLMESFNPRAASLASVGLADFALFEGRLNDAKDILEKGISEDLENGFDEEAIHKKTILAETLIQMGEKALAVKAADNAVAGSSKESILFTSAQVYVEANMEDKARSLAKKLKDLLQPEPQAYAKIIEGELSLKAGNVTEAISHFQDAQALIDTWIGHFSLGRVYNEAGAFIEAHSEFELCLKRMGEVAAVFLDDFPSLRYLPPVYYYLGNAQEGLKSPAAAESFRKFLQIKKNADPGDPMVEETRRRLKTR
jgi:tetratricopeptide (TPR) repeat protein/predicted Ser/Thr protein kinase